MEKRSLEESIHGILTNEDASFVKISDVELTFKEDLELFNTRSVYWKPISYILLYWFYNYFKGEVYLLKCTLENVKIVLFAVDWILNKVYEVIKGALE